MLVVRGCGFFYTLGAKWEPGSASACPPLYVYSAVHILNLINPTKQLSMHFNEWYPDDSIKEALG